MKRTIFVSKLFFAKSMMVLLVVSFMDELISGVSAVGSPYILESFDVSFLKAGGLVLSIPEIFTIFLVPFLLILSDHFGRKYFTTVSLFFMGIVSILMACTLNFWVFLILLSIWGIMNSVGVGLSQIILIETYPDNKEEVLVKWGYYGSLGDIATPLLFIVLAWLGFGWKVALIISGIIFILISLFIFFSKQTYGKAKAGDSWGVSERMIHAFKSMKNKTLAFWMLVLTVATVLDEILISFASLHLHSTFGLSSEQRNVVLTIFMLSTVIGYKGVNVLIGRMNNFKILWISGLSTSVTLFVFAYSPNVYVAVTFFVLSGGLASAIYPLASAKAFNCLPSGQEGTVSAILNIFSLIGTLVPIGLGAVAVWFGLSHTIAIIAVTPLFIFLTLRYRSQ